MQNDKNRTLRFENLQKRELMAVDLAGGELRISGSASGDQIEISQELRPSYVFQSGRIQRVTREMVRVDINRNSPRFFDAALVDRIFAEGLGGDDTIHNNTDLPSVIYGNDGDDILRGGTSEDTLVGGNDDDSLYGRAGRDILSGGPDNDGLFGGEGYDMVFGGSGANRYLSTRDGDYLFRPDGDDALIEFRAGSYTINRFGFFTGGSWTDEQIEMVDGGLRRIHQSTGTTNLLKKSDGGRIQFVHRGLQRYGDSNVGAWNDDRRINVHLGMFELAGSGDPRNELAAAQSVIHEVGHFWDDPWENDTVDEFRRISRWSADGETHRANEDTDFARAYGAENAREDFATAFAATFMAGEYIDYDDGWSTPDYSNRPVMQVKLSYMRFLDSRV